MQHLWSRKTSEVGAGRAKACEPVALSGGTLWLSGGVAAQPEPASRPPRVSEAWVTGIIQTASLFLTPRLGWWKFSIAVMDTSLCMNMKFVRSVGRVSRLKGGGMIVQLGNPTCTGGKRSMTDDRIRSRDRPA